MQSFVLGPARVPCISGRGIDQTDQGSRASIPKEKELESNNKQNRDTFDP
jgi:hypothetical protein